MTGLEFKSGPLIPKSSLPRIPASCCTSVVADGKLWASGLGVSREEEGAWNHGGPKREWEEEGN